MIRLLEISNRAFFWYYLATNLAYLAMLIIALKRARGTSAGLKATG